MYRSMRGAFEQFDKTHLLGSDAGAQNALFLADYLPNCRYGIIAGTVLAFARALGEFGATIMLAGNLPGKTTTLSVAVYSAMAAGNNELAYKYVLINLAFSFAVLLVVNITADRPQQRRNKGIPAAKGGV